MRPCPTRCRGHLVQPVLLVEIPVIKLDKARLSVSDLVPFAQVGPQPLLYVRPYMFQGLAAVLEVKIANPAARGGVNLSHDLVQRKWCPLAFSEDGYTILDRLQRLL
jgi:hypothetical protein